MKRESVIITLCLLSITSLAFGQTGLGEISGFVYDEQGAVIPDVTIVITSPALMGQRTITTTSLGAYRAINLPPGLYTLQVSKETYQKTEFKDIRVRAGKTSSFNIVLKVGEFAETLTIVHNAPIIDLKNPERAINIDGDFISRLPLSPSQEWTRIFSLIPSAVTDADFRNVALSSPWMDVNIHGALSRENMLVMEGMRLQSNSSLQPTTFTASIIEDVEIVPSGAGAAMQSGQGAYINIVTKSGGNDFHGAAKLVIQPTDWNWENQEDADTPKLGQYLPELSLGGPIIRDKTWFFASYLYDHRNEGVFRSKETLYWLKELGFGEQDWDNTRRSHRFFGKLTHAVTDSSQLAVTFNWDRTKNLIGLEKYDESARYHQYGGGPFVALNYTSTVSDTLSYSVSASYRSGETSEFSDGDQKPDVVRYGETMYFFGQRYGAWGTEIVTGGRGWETSRYSYNYEIKADGNYFNEELYGSHDAHFGIYWLPKEKYYEENLFAEPYYQMSQARNDSGEWVTFEATYFNNEATYPTVRETSNVAAYLQDTWTLNDRLTINLGLRVEKNLDEIGVFDKILYSPNIGASYSITGDGTQAVRFSYGRKSELLSGFDLNPNNGFVSATSGASFYSDPDMDGVWDTIISYPVKPQGPRTTDEVYWSSGTPYFFDPDLKPGKVDTLQLEYAAVLPGDLTFDAAYIYKLFRDTVTYYKYYNYIWEGDEPVSLRYPEYPNARHYTNNKWSTHHYQAMEFSLARNFRDNWQLLASYSYQLSILKGEWSPYDPERYMFPESWFEDKNFNRLPRHVLRIAGSYLAPWDIMFNASVSVRSATPTFPRVYYYGEGIDVPRYITLSGQVVLHPFHNAENLVEPRSAERESPLSTLSTVNVGVGKVFRLGQYSIETQLQIFNLFNNGDYTSAAWYALEEKYLYYDPQAPRAAQLLVKLTF